jgi:hypothetical protein
MSKLVKKNVERLYHTIIAKSEDITIIENQEKKSEFVSDFASFLTGPEWKQLFIMNTDTLEGEIDKLKNTYRKRKAKDDYFYYRYANQTEEEYVQEELYSNYSGNHVNTFLLEKYRPTRDVSDSVLLCELKLSRSAQSRIFFAFFFNEASQLCFDYISIKGTRWRSHRVTIENDINILSEITSLEAIKKLIHSFPDEEVKNKKEYEIRTQKNIKNRVKKDKIKELSSKAFISRLRSLLKEKEISVDIYERVHMYQIYVPMKKGKTVLRVPKKDIRKRLEILPSLCEKIIEADQLNIQCKYKQNI